MFVPGNGIMVTVKSMNLIQSTGVDMGWVVLVLIVLCLLGLAMEYL